MAEFKNAAQKTRKKVSIDVLKMLFGFGLLTILGLLAIGIAIGKVSAETSFGLEPIITTLATLAGAFAGWAFREEKHEPGDINGGPTTAEPVPADKDTEIPVHLS